MRTRRRVRKIAAGFGTRGVNTAAIVLQEDAAALAAQKRPGARRLGVARGELPHHGLLVDAQAEKLRAQALLALVDAAGMPADLESTNASNLERYRSVGFVDSGEFTLPRGGPVVTTMWREPRRTPAPH